METHRFGGTWTEEKLAALREYLSAYTQILKNKRLTRYYIDAFAGTGDRTRLRTHLIRRGVTTAPSPSETFAAPSR